MLAPAAALPLCKPKCAPACGRGVCRESPATRDPSRPGPARCLTCCTCPLRLSETCPRSKRRTCMRPRGLSRFSCDSRSFSSRTCSMPASSLARRKLEMTCSSHCKSDRAACLFGSLHSAQAAHFDSHATLAQTQCRAQTGKGPAQARRHSCTCCCRDASRILQRCYGACWTCAALQQTTRYVRAAERGWPGCRP